MKQGQKQVADTLFLIYSGSPRVSHTIETNFKLLIQRYAQFQFFKNFALVSPPHFVHDFSRKIFPKLNCINY